MCTALFLQKALNQDSHVQLIVYIIVWSKLKGNKYAFQWGMYKYTVAPGCIGETDVKKTLQHNTEDMWYDCQWNSYIHQNSN